MKLKTQQNITEMHLRTLNLFTHGFNREYYVREISKLLKISPRTSQLTLEGLEKKSVLESTVRGKIKNYKLKKNEISKNYLILTEIYKKIRLIEKHEIIKEIIQKISPQIDGIGIIFGSYVKGIERKSSDLDLFIIGKCKKNEIDRISRIYKIKLNIKNYPSDIFEKNFKSDILIKEMLNNHIVFLNVEKFIDIANG